MYEQVLVATDGSESASAAVEHAIAVARGCDATLHAVYAIETRTAYDNVVDAEEIADRLREEGEAALERVEAAAEGVDLVTSIGKGVPAEVIADYAAQQGVDLVVVGARGGSAFKRVLLGSTSEQLLDELDVPVVVVDDA